ncbi:Rv1535 domain-containing protein [Mycobacterium sp. 1274756.6]|uniref:Rv1535 domain-containing protein n=1 Tax=Mycobacterium sp. 1274756.6 TaxID=1834076 RepID=UPI000801ECCC|nr:Rv1535 domain-containing protein [Mycobacterium sp. 1274756.6]OBJ69155.1 hypothetical protein A5643_13110 [Mycobacterium sp. 1274756.6]
MATIAYSDVTTPARAAVNGFAELHRRDGDPLVEGATRLLSVPLRQVYALAWRAGILTVR